MNDELLTKIIGRATLVFPELNYDLQKQLKLRREIAEVLYNYEINSRCTDIVKSDIEEKARLFIMSKVQCGMSKNTVYWYKGMLRNMITYFNKPVSCITTTDLRNLLATLKMEGNRKEGTINSYITRIRVFWQWLQEEEFIMNNPAIKIKKVKLPKKIKKPYSSISLEKLRNACCINRDKALFEIMESTACRVGEIVNIKLNDVNMEEQSIIVTGKGRKERVVYFSTKAKLFLQEYLAERKGESEYLFLSLKKPYTPLTTRGVGYMLSRLKERAALKERVFAHKFRRTKATNLLNAGMSLQGVQQFLGHENPTTTQIYATLSQENLKNEYRRLTE